VSNQDHKRRLQVVPKVDRKELRPQDFYASLDGAQTNLFPAPRPGMLIFVYFPDVTEDEFRKALEFSKPCAVFELRNTPRFDIGKLNRKTVFEYFDTQHTKYVDITSCTPKDGTDSSVLNEVADAFKKDCARFDRPVMFLLNSYNTPSGISRQIINLISSIKKISPEVLSVPHFALR
jgi:hypothetical protein